MENPGQSQEFKQNYAPEPQSPEKYKAALTWEAIRNILDNDEAKLFKTYQNLKNLKEAVK